MIVAESRRGRRIVGRLDRGVDLFEALLSVCRERNVRAGELRALGSLETVEVAEYDQSAKAWKAGRKFAGGGFEIANLTGNVSERDGGLALHAHVTLMRDRDNGVEMVGGHVVAARVFALEFVIEAFDDVILRRGVDAATGLPLWREAIGIPAAPEPARAAAAPAVAQSFPEDEEEDEDGEAPVEEEVRQVAPLSRLEAAPRAAASAPSSPSPTWSQVAAASARKPDAAAEEEEDAVEAGDVIVHPTFGRCEVQRIEGAYEFAHVRLRNGRLVRLSLDVLKLSAAGREDNRRVFRARVE